MRSQVKSTFHQCCFLVVLAATVGLISSSESIAQEKQAKKLPILQWNQDCLKGLRWGMSRKEVERALGKKLQLVRDSRTDRTTWYSRKFSSPYLGARIRFTRNRTFRFNNDKLFFIDFEAVRGLEEELIRGMLSNFGKSIKLPDEGTNHSYFGWCGENVIISAWMTRDAAGKPRKGGAGGMITSRKFRPADHGKDTEERYLRLKALQDDKSTCPICKGDGKCVKCKGRGTLTRVKASRQCDLCSGTGRQRRQACPRCEGQGGWVSTETVDCERCDRTRKCRTCGGSGKRKK